MKEVIPLYHILTEECDYRIFTNFAPEPMSARGRKGGRPKSLDSTKTELLYKLHDEKAHTFKEICQILGMSKPYLPEAKKWGVEGSLASL